MSTMTARPADDERHLLAEGPVWDAAGRRVLWVDIEAGDVLTGSLRDGKVEPQGRIHVDSTVGAVVPGPDGVLLVAGGTGLFTITADGEARPLAAVLPDGSGRRLNDGGCDPAGRFLVGSLRLDGRSDREVLVRLEDDGSLTTLDSDLTLSNGLAWSPDGTVLYSVDTHARVVRVRDYDVATGASGPPRPLLQVDDGFPDGLTVDADGNLWLALWAAGQVRCYSPDGAVRHVVEVDAPQTSSVAFVGDDLTTLLITTASTGMDAEQLAAHPGSGLLFTADVSPWGIRGLPMPPWNGRALLADTGTARA